jgi:hypothetical protein
MDVYATMKDCLPIGLHAEKNFADFDKEKLTEVSKYYKLKSQMEFLPVESWIVDVHATMEDDIFVKIECPDGSITTFTKLRERLKERVFYISKKGNIRQVGNFFAGRFADPMDIPLTCNGFQSLFCTCDKS